MRFGALVLSGTLAFVAPAQDAATPGAGEPERLAVRVDAPARAFVHEPVVVTVTIAYDAAWLREAAVPLFRQQLDAPFHVDVPWLLGAPERAVSLMAAPETVEALRIAVGDRTASAEVLPPQQRDGRTFERVALRLRWLPLAPGPAPLAPVEVRYAFATRFTDDVLRGRQPVDRQERRVASGAASIDVQPLPQPAPPGFSGAVGEFQLQATSGAERLAVGGSFAVEVEVLGDGNLDRFAPPQPPQLDGFFVQGVVERAREPGRGRVFVFDVLALRAGVDAMPGIPWVAFSPQAQRYVTLQSASVPVLVDAAPDEASLPPRVRELIEADRAKLRARERWPISVWLVLAVAAAAAVRWSFGRAARRRSTAAARAALERLRDGAATDAAATALAFEAVLAAATGLERFDLGTVLATLRRRGVHADLVGEVEALHGELDEARFGGPRPDAERVLATAQALLRA